MQDTKTITLEQELLFELKAVNVAPGSRGIMRTALPVYQGTTKLLPPDLDALILTSDLQMHDRCDVPVSERVIMGHVVCHEMANMSEAGLLPPTNMTGVILAGDLYASPEMKKRGTTGDVQEVWKDFAETYRWVTGVAGNHDLFRSAAAFGSCFNKHNNAHPLHDDVVQLDGLTIAGISGVFGNPMKRPWRNDYSDFEVMLSHVLDKSPDILVLHEGPNSHDGQRRGSDFVRDLIGKHPHKPALIVCGHRHWPTPLADGPAPSMILNTDASVVVLKRSP